MNKILFIGDGHFKATRLDLVTQFIAWLDKTIKEVNPQMIVYLGDFFDNHSIIRCEIMSMFNDHIKRNRGYQKYYILGNHDQFRPNDNKYHALQSLKQVHKDFIVIDQIAELGDITFVPFIYDFAKFPRETQPIVIAHQTFIGADYGYTKADAGIDADEIDADIIISGHVHKRQSFGKVIYPGSSYAQSINDIDQNKGLMLFDTDDYTYEFIDCPLPSWRGIKFELSADYSTTDMHQDIEAAINDTDHWVIDIEGPKAEVVSYLDSKVFLALKKGKKVRTRATHTDSAKEQIKIQAVTMDDIVSTYVDKVYQGTLSKSDIISKALEIKNKANS